MTASVTYPAFVRSRGAARVHTWWGKAWMRAIEEAAFDAPDLVKGRALARSGRVGAIGVSPGRAVALVSAAGGPGIDDHLSRLEVAELGAGEWDDFLDGLASASGHVAALLEGELPHQLMEDAEQSGVELLPYAADLTTECDCGAWTQPCLHSLALLNQVTWLVDDDPFVMFLLRGRSRADLLAGLNARFDARSEAPDPSAEASTAVDEAAARAREILDLAEQAPLGDGLADADVAAYDEQVSRLLEP